MSICSSALFLFHSCSEADEIYKICNVIGSPTGCVWAEGLELANAINYQFPLVFCSDPDLFVLFFQVTRMFNSEVVW